MRIWFSGIGGVGIGSLALVAADAGYDVVGSDLSPSLTTAELEARGIEIVYGQDGATLRQTHQAAPIDRVVHTAALKPDHPELLAADELGIPTAKRDVFLNELIREHQLKLLAISGTHGKTTVTGMAIWAFQQLGIPVSWSIGTTIRYGAAGHYDPDAEWFVLECDEFDRNMLRFSPTVAVLPAVGYDHPDTYPSREDYQAAFAQFAAQSGATYIWDDQAGGALNQVPGVRALPARDVSFDEIPLPGAHNRRNAALLAAALVEQVGPGREGDVRAALASFPGTDRRFERLAENLYSDYGHHPTEIAATLQLAREVADRVVLVYQPHQNIRQHELLGHYGDEFRLAERTFWLPTYLSREDPNLRVLEPAELFASVSNPEAVETAEWGEELWQRLDAYRADGVLVLAMGAGSIDGWFRERLAQN